MRGLGYTVDSLIDGAYAGDYYDEGDKIDLTLMGREDAASAVRDIAELPIATPRGALVPLGAVADVELSNGPEQINRSERERAITIVVSPPESMALADAIETMEQDILAPLRAQGQIGGAYQVRLAGTADKLSATWDALGMNLLLALLITYLLMAALFESWIYPFVVIVSVPMGAVGGLIGLALLNKYVAQPLDVLTMLGFIILIGTVVNNAILIVHQSLVYMREEGQTPADAVFASVKSRIRPDLHDDDNHRLRSPAAGHQPRGRQRALPWARQRLARWPCRVDGVHAASRAVVVSVDAGAACWRRVPVPRRRRTLTREVAGDRLPPRLLDGAQKKVPLPDQRAAAFGTGSGGGSRTRACRADEMVAVRFSQ